MGDDTQLQAAALQNREQLGQLETRLKEASCSPGPPRAPTLCWVHDQAAPRPLCVWGPSVLAACWHCV